MMPGIRRPNLGNSLSAVTNAGGSFRVTRPSLGHFVRTPAERSGLYRELFGMLDAGTPDVRIGARCPLADVGAAQAALAGRGTARSVLLEV